MNRQVLFALALMVSVCSAQSPKLESDPLVGLWGVEQAYGPLARGELTIDGRSETWHAQINGFDVAVIHENGIKFVLPDGNGDFRGISPKIRRS